MDQSSLFDRPGRRGAALSRRQLLQLGGMAALVTAGTQFCGAAPAWAGDTYDAMRAVWVGLLTGSGFDATKTPFSTALSTLGSQAGTYQSAMSTSGSSSLWSDVPAPASNSAGMGFKLPHPPPASAS